MTEKKEKKIKYSVVSFHPDEVPDGETRVFIGDGGKQIAVRRIGDRLELRELWED